MVFFPGHFQPERPEKKLSDDDRRLKRESGEGLHVPARLGTGIRSPFHYPKPHDGAGNNTRSRSLGIFLKDLCNLSLRCRNILRGDLPDDVMVYGKIVMDHLVS